MTPLLAQGSRTDRSFERLYRRHVADVYHYALAVLRNPTDAEDVTQTTFMNAYRAFERGERPQAPQNWLIAIAHNVCRQRFRQSTRRPQEVAFEEDVADVIADDDAPSAHDIRRALGHLAFNQRAALVMRELEGRTYAEIGEVLGLSVSAVETLIFRARRALREQLEGALTCGEAELAISRQVDGRLPRNERGALRAHLRECPDCATFARSQRAQRAAFKTLGAVPLPASLSSFSSFFGGGSAAVGTAVATKAAAVLAAGALVGGVGYGAATKTSILRGSHSAKTRAATVAGPAAAGAAALSGGTARPVAAQSSPEAAKAAARPEKRAAAAKATPKVAKARGKSHAGGAARGPTGGGGKSSTANANRGSGSSASSRPAQSRGNATRTRARGTPTRGRSSSAPGRAKSSSSSSSASRGRSHEKPVVKVPAVPATSAKPPAPPGQADKTPKPPKPPKAPDPPPAPAATVPAAPPPPAPDPPGQDDKKKK